jgi:hypothetical protein
MRRNSMKRRLWCIVPAFFLCCFSACGGYFSQGDPRDDSEQQQPELPEEPVEELPAFTGLAGSTWLWGQSLLEFTEDTVIFRGDASRPYAFTISGGSLTEGEEGGGVIDTLGEFIVNEERTVLEILNYRNNGPASDELTGETKSCNAVFRRRDPAVLTPDYLGELSTATVWGTEWNVGGVGGGDNGDRFKDCQWIIFFTQTEAVNRSGGGVFIDAYTFDKDAQEGWIYFINEFEIRDNWGTLYIPGYKKYGHDMPCVRVR